MLKLHQATESSETWHVSPAGFRALRHSCLFSRQACAAFLGVGLRTVYHWEAGRSRIPFSAVRLLRFVRLGDLGALADDWAGWTLNRLGLHDPAGRTYRLDAMRAWWITCEQAQFWREGRPSLSAAAHRSSGSPGRCSSSAPVRGSAPTSTPPEADRGRRPERLEGASSFPPAQPGRSADTTRETAAAAVPRDPAAPGDRSALDVGRAAAGAAEPPHPPRVAATDAAEAGAPGTAAGAGRAGSPAEGRRRRRDGRRSAPQGAGLVSSLKQVRSEGHKPKRGKASKGVPDAR